MDSAQKIESLGNVFLKGGILGNMKKERKKKKKRKTVSKIPGSYLVKGRPNSVLVVSLKPN